jgi:hypothetical protein
VTGVPWLKRSVAVLVLLVAVAGATRLAYELLAPVTPYLIALVVLIVVYATALGHFRR